MLKSFAEANRLPLPEHTGDIDKRFVSETLIDGHVAAYNALDSLDDVQAQQRRDFHVQLFRAIATDPSNPSFSMTEASPKPDAPSARSGAQAMMRQHAERFIDSILDRTAEGSTKDAQVQKALKGTGEYLGELFSKRPDLLNKQVLAAILSAVIPLRVKNTTIPFKNHTTLLSENITIGLNNSVQKSRATTKKCLPKACLSHACRRLKPAPNRRVQS